MALRRAHLKWRRRRFEPVERAGGATGRDLEHVGVDHGRAHIAVTEQLLHSADVGAAL